MVSESGTPEMKSPQDELLSLRQKNPVEKKSLQARDGRQSQQELKITENHTEIRLMSKLKTQKAKLMLREKHLFF